MYQRSNSLFFIALVLALAACRADHTSGNERSADLTSEYLDLSFDGSIEVEETALECRYKIPSLTIRFVKVPGRLTKIIHIDRLRVAALTKRSVVDEHRYPLDVLLDAPGTEARVSNITFSIPKTTIAKADFVGLALTGRDILQDDGRFASLDRASYARLFSPDGRAVAWPITARSNIEKEVTRLDRDSRERIWRSPHDPEDYCSSVRIH